jgi:hypothetical protein
MKPLLTLMLIVVAASPAWAQRIEIAPLVGLTTDGAIDQRAPGVQELKIEDGFTWGGRVTWFLSTRIGLEVLWSYRDTDFSMTTATGEADLFSMTVNQYLGNIVYRFGGEDASWRPFIFGGVGATSFDAPDLEGETKASWNAGGGLTWFLQRHLGLTMQARYKPTVLGGSSSDICTPFGFCQGRLTAFDVAGGAVVRF